MAIFRSNSSLEACHADTASVHEIQVRLDGSKRTAREGIRVVRDRPVQTGQVDFDHAPAMGLDTCGLPFVDRVGDTDFDEELTRHLSPGYFAKCLRMRLQELAELARVHPSTVRHQPESLQMQAFLPDLVRVVSAAAPLSPGPSQHWFLIKNAPVPEFEHRTLLTVIASGRADDAIVYLDAISSGFAG